LINSGEPKGRHAVILCHPDPASFNRAIADTYCAAVREAGQEAILRDLYAIGFDPILKADERPTLPDIRIGADVAHELSILRGCDLFVLIYPIWFGTPPALMKGYVERVLGSGVAPKSLGLRERVGFLAGRRLLSFTTSATRAPWLSEQGEWLALRYLFDRYLVDALDMRADEHIHFPGIVAGLDPAVAAAHLARVRQQATHSCALVAAERHQAAVLGAGGLSGTI
jgi:NAD(P)H dehydrogenase (quinone)